MDQDLMQKIFTYNRSVIAQEHKAQKVEEIEAMLQPMGERPSLPELLSFLQKLEEVLQAD